MPRGNIRKRRDAEEDDDKSENLETGEDWRARLQLVKGLQKGRQKSQGINIDPATQSTSATTKPSDEEEIMGGYIKEQSHDKNDQKDPERERYIKEQLDKRLGRNKAEANSSQAAKADDMYAIPAALRTQKVNQEDVSAWMTGIVEVPLSVEQRLKNVEETEHAKRKLLSQPRESLAGDSQGKEKQMSRLTLPLRFGQHSKEDLQWQETALRKQQQPQEWKKKRRAAP